MNAEKIAKLRALTVSTGGRQTESDRRIRDGKAHDALPALLDEIQDSAHRLAASQRGNQRLSDEGKKKDAEILLLRDALDTCNAKHIT